MKFYRTPLLKRDNSYFENTMTKTKNDNVNTYPIKSIFEFISKLNKLIMDHIADGRKIVVSIKNPKSISSVRIGLTPSSFSKSIPSEVFIFGGVLQESFSGRRITNTLTGSKFFDFIKDQKGISNPMYATISDIIIDNTKVAVSFNNYMRHVVTSTKSLKRHFSDKTLDLPISLNFGKPLGTIYIISEKIGDDIALVTWSLGKSWEGHSVRERALDVLSPKEEKSDRWHDDFATRTMQHMMAQSAGLSSTPRGRGGYHYLDAPTFE